MEMGAASLKEQQTARSYLIPLTIGWEITYQEYIFAANFQAII
jgi:hypothetical protein